ncbi:AAA family ATPase [Spirosoma panaciterrae]|uniref:AAA family ATPase n=1 Tax=Spirosoma panaciterrae TaxID=496058 RepID=UPI00036C445A|nr:AAA family ATPase [Spirosoma panaciterrae]
MNEEHNKNTSILQNIHISDGTDLNNLASEMQIGMFRIRTAQDVLDYASQLPAPVELYPNLIIENELTILFADTGIGKTVFATQVGIDIATGASKTVLYVDLELNDRQFLKRYQGQDGLLFRFPPNFYRADFTPQFQAPNGLSYLDYFIQSLEQAIDDTGAEVIIIDNQTKLVAGDTDSAKTAIPVLEHLTRLKLNKGITIIILEHNKKVDSSRPISLNDLQGSKMKSNFADAVFSIGRSLTDKNLRYIKQLKARSAELVYDTENVATYEITKEDGYLHFAHIGFSSEFEHLRQPNRDEGKNDTLTEQYNCIQDLKRAGYRGDSLARKMGMSKGNISKIEKKYETELSCALSNQFIAETMQETY